uniref:DALR anticodon-binding domain-containing protein 3-like n=1 Tax=Crassostrea virginica TaxID=6565 RepID=A0A8B8B8J2_CRAVI|nr:DALR anticodon-binding domain-containing protein 3-like [Crassostrea virginica]
MFSDLVTDDILDVLKRTCVVLGRSSQNVIVQKRQKSLRDGDFCVPKGCFQINKEEFDHLKKSLIEESKQWVCPLREVKFDSFNSMLISLDRPLTYKTVISSVLRLNGQGPCLKGSKDAMLSVELQKQKEAKPTQTDLLEKMVLVCVPECDDCRSLDQLRGLVLTQHVVNLLHRNGLKTRLASFGDNVKVQKWLDLINFNMDIIRDSKEDCDVKNILDLARQSKYKLSQRSNDEEGNKVVHSETTSEHSAHKIKSDMLVLDAEKYLSSVSKEKGIYDKNLGKIHITDNDGITDSSIQIAHLQKCIEKMDQCDCVLHIIPDKKSFQLQKIDLGMHMLFGNTPNQIQMVFGSVAERKAPAARKIDAEEFYNLRFSQMKEASVMKYGECVKGAGWHQTIQNLTVASVKFELLLNVSRNTVKLDLSETNDFGGGVDNRAGAFVMYNCARLATLFKHFTKAVEDGIYPPMPRLESIDFSLLREEDEWTLFFNYIFPYNDIVRSTVADMIPTKGIYSKIGTHKICNYLIGLSRCLSSYYSHTHVLVENRPNLLFTMYARLYLLEAVHTVMKDSLHLMGICPPTQL